jgi:hypothetical protein
LPRRVLRPEIRQQSSPYFRRHFDQTLPAQQYRLTHGPTFRYGAGTYSALTSPRNGSSPSSAISFLQRRPMRFCRCSTCQARRRFANALGFAAAGRLYQRGRPVSGALRAVVQSLSHPVVGAERQPRHGPRAPTVRTSRISRTAALSAAWPAVKRGSCFRIRRSGACPMCRVRRSSSRSTASPRTRGCMRRIRSSAPARRYSSMPGRAFTRSSPAAFPSRSAARKVDRTFLADLDKGNLQLFMGAGRSAHHAGLLGL